MQEIIADFTQSSLAAELMTIVVMLLVISVGFWILIGRFRLHNALINFYISFAIVQAIPSSWLRFSDFSSFIFFAGLVIIFTLIDSSLFDIHLSGSGLAIWQVVVLSVLEAGLLVSIVANLTPKSVVLKYFSESSYGYFASSISTLLWMIIPLLFLIYIDKKNG